MYAGTEHGVFKSTNQGASWTAINAGIPSSWKNETQWAVGVSALTIDPSNPRTLYIGTEKGGVLKSINGGENWIPVNLGITKVTVSALAISPRTSSTVYVGTSDNFGFGAGSGVFKSTDGGKTWESVEGFTDVGVTSLAIDPVEGKIIYGATLGRGIVKSTDDGKTWEAANAGLTANLLTSLAIDPANPDTVYAGTFNGGIFKSNNGGITWSHFIKRQCVTSLAFDPSKSGVLYIGILNTLLKSINGDTGLVVVKTFSDFTVEGIVIDPSMPRTLYINAGRMGIFKSIDGGDNWTHIYSIIDRVGIQSLAIDSSNPARLYAGTGLLPSLATNEDTEGVGVLRSTDKGLGWVVVKGNLTPIEVGALAIDPSTSGTLYAATFGEGVLKSSDGGARWTAMNNGLTNLYIKALAIDPSNPGTLYAGTQGGGVFKTTNGGAIWKPTGF
jgi:photosystem II stability/assembly factor-like uncharacterized protein